jgi:hypothetical protein
MTVFMLPGFVYDTNNQKTTQMFMEPLIFKVALWSSPTLRPRRTRSEQVRDVLTLEVIASP